MHFLVHDFAGHPFQAQLSRQLARRGHLVTHAFAAGLPGPKGQLTTVAGDPACFNIRGIPLSSRFKKYSAYRRFISHRKYAASLKELIRQIRPDVVLSGNTPIDVQAELLWECRKSQIGFIHWVQDIYSQAIKFYLKKRLPMLGSLISGLFEQVERRVALNSDHTIVIAPEFSDVLRGWQVPASRISVIENWAVLADMPLASRENGWSRTHAFGSTPVLMYSGTLGMKHRPDLLYLLAKRLQRECVVVVITDGIGKNYLERMPLLKNLRIMPFQPYDKMPEVLASADILLATLETDAGQFAVPSKILTYLCAGRPILLAGPRENLSASVIERSGGGLVVDPNNPDDFVDAAKSFIFDVDYRVCCGNKARLYAEKTFDPSRITDAFENVLNVARRTDATESAKAALVSA
jgi:colanic acid biosynthesis glycosyl transferase WcaI